MQVVMAPATLHQPSLFLGGSISGVEDWQSQFIKDLGRKMNEGPCPFTTDLIIYNPRRNDFDANDEEQFQQINWEFRHLRLADILIFWFAKETVAPTTLFELGRHSQIAGRDIYVGADPEYPRIRDLKIQMAMLKNRDLLTLRGRIRESPTELVDDVCEWLAEYETHLDHGGRLY